MRGSTRGKLRTKIHQRHLLFFPGKIRQSDSSLLRLRRTHAPVQLCPHLRPLFPVHMLSCPVKRMSLLGTRVSFRASVDVTHTLEFSLMERSFTWNPRSHELDSISLSKLTPECSLGMVFMPHLIHSLYQGWVPSQYSCIL